MNQVKGQKAKGKKESAELFFFAFCLFTFALLVRLVGLRWGLPNAEHWGSYHPDERQTVFAVFQMVEEGGFNPHFFNYPSLYLYLVYAAHLVAGMLGLTHAITPDNAAWAFSHDVILAGRVVTAVLGAATAPLVLLIGREPSERKPNDWIIGGLAGVLLALMPGHVQHSHFATVDVPATFFVTLSLWLATRALRLPESIEGAESEAGTVEGAVADAARPHRKYLLWSAFVAGLAAATKYNAGLVLVAPLTAFFFSSGNASNGRWKIASLMIGTAVLGFLLGCPYSALSFGEFWGNGKDSGFAYELFVHPREGSGEVFLQTGRFGWWHHLAFNLPFAMTAPLLLLALFGVVIVSFGQFSNWFFIKISKHRKELDSAFSQPRHEQCAGSTLPLLVFVLFYLFTLGFSQVRFLRYTLPLLPALCLFSLWSSNIVTVTLVNAATWKSQLSALLSEPPARHAPLTKWLSRCAWTSYSLMITLALAAMLDVLYPFTQTDPRDQAVAWMKANAPAGSTVGLTTDRPWFSTPPFSPRDAPPGSGVSPEEAIAASTNYPLSLLAFDTQKLTAQKPQYVVMSEFDWRDKERLGDAGFRAFMQQLSALYTLQQTFKNRSPLSLSGRAFVPHDFLYPNPAVRIYKRRAG